MARENRWIDDLLHGLLRLTGATVLLALGACDGMISPKGSRTPDALEYQYILLAAESGMSELCRRIAPNSVSIGAFDGDGRSVAFLRSRCYLEVALEQRTVSTCPLVRPAGSWLYGAGRYTPDSCYRLVNALIAEDRPRMMSAANHALLLGLMGYDERDLAQLAARGGGEQWSNLFDDLNAHRRQELRARLEMLPRFSNRST